MNRLIFLGDLCSNIPYTPHLDNFDEIFGADVACCNLEGPILLTPENTPIRKTGPNLSVHKSWLHFLERNNFALVNLANNHIFDYGSGGMNSTIMSLEQHNISYVGVKNNDLSCVACFRLGDESVAIIAFAESEFSSPFINEESSVAVVDHLLMLKSITKARLEHDFTVVQFHAGNEFCDIPSPWLRKLCKFAIEAGADMVICHHSHCVSGKVIYAGKPIYYGLGNFFFPSDNTSRAWFSGLCVELTNKNGSLFVSEFPFSFSHTDKKYFKIDSQNGDTTNDRFAYLTGILSDEASYNKQWIEFVEERGRRLMSHLFYPSGGHISKGLQRISKSFEYATVSDFNFLKKMNILTCESNLEVMRHKFRKQYHDAIKK